MFFLSGMAPFVKSAASYYYSYTIRMKHGHFLFKLEVLRIKQIMTGLEGNRHIYLPREIQDGLLRSFY